jgi:CheY-like chemotaxis protein
MPDMDGSAVVAEMNADPTLRSIPVVIVTSAELTPSVRTSLGPAAAILAKSNVSRDVVRRVMAEALGQSAGSS